MGLPAPVLVVLLVMNAVLVGSFAPRFWQAVVTRQGGRALGLGLLIVLHLGIGFWAMWVLWSQPPEVR